MQLTTVIHIHLLSATVGQVLQSHEVKSTMQAIATCTMLQPQCQHFLTPPLCGAFTSSKRSICRYMIRRAALNTQTVVDLLELPPAVARQVQQACSAIPAETLQANIQELRKHYFLKDIQALASSNPQVFALPIAGWCAFFEGYDLGKEAFWKALRYSGEHLAAGDVYTAGAAIRWLKQLGPWDDRDITDRIIPCYPQVLCTPTETLQRLFEQLHSLGLDEAAVQRMLWEFPGMMADFREEQLPLVTRMIESRRSKYTNGGTYID